MDKLSKVEKFYIKGHPSDSADSLSRTLKVDIKLVRNYQKFLATKSDAEERKEEREENAKTKTILEKFSINKRYGTAVMTQTASEIGDEHTRNSRKRPNDEKKDTIHKIRPE